MSTSQMAVPATNTASRCKCGCSDCQGECCTLDCLVRPNFFCGQLLTDRDLSSLVDWVGAKAALQRFRAGWGVVCGLETTCSHKEKEQNRVYVAPGYAVDCCGRDIVVCDPIWYDFTCDPSTDPCCREKKTVPPKDPTRRQDTKFAEEHRLLCIPPSELRAFDLCLLLDEQMTAGQRALVRGNCVPMDGCHYTRIRETGKLVATEVSDPFTRTITEDESEYRKEFAQLLNTLLHLQSSPKKVLEYIEGRGGLHTFCFVEECLCRFARTDEKQAQLEALIREAIFYILMDFRIHSAQRLCASCKDNSCAGDGVPLTRVWIWNKNTTNCKICKVVYIDSHPPYRHPYECCIHAKTGDAYGLSRYIWRESEEVLDDLRRQGFAEVRVHEVKTGDIDVFETLVQEEVLSLSRKTKSLIMYVYKDHCGVPRVLGFRSL